uniref:HTH CENPB-type domain-containing protein n=1 Tax=Amphimedon queenslandica TaxID=400682 RepID=A0A1X7TSS5_AMPQE
MIVKRAKGLFHDSAIDFKASRGWLDHFMKRKLKATWDVPPDTVTKSFLSCAITTSTCGKDDNEIHCFKSGQPCEAGRASLAHEISLLNIQQDIDDDSDPFADDLDFDEDDLNEACIEDDENDPGFDSNHDSDYDLIYYNIPGNKL